jgi:hypothetical protein
MTRLLPGDHVCADEGAGGGRILVGEAWIRHDVMQSPQTLPLRRKKMEKDIAGIEEKLNPMLLLEELQDHAERCLREMSWFQRQFNRSLVREIRSRSWRDDSQAEPRAAAQEAPSVLVWKDDYGVTRIRGVGIEVS